MRLDVLIRVCTHVESILQEHNILGHLDVLNKSLGQLQKDPQNETFQNNVRTARADLNSALAKIRAPKVGPEFVRVAEEMGFARLLDGSMRVALDQAFSDHFGSPSAITQAVNTIRAELKQIVSRCGNIRNGLGTIFEKHAVGAEDRPTSLVLHFWNGNPISMGDLAEVAHDWQEILRAAANVCRDPKVDGYIEYVEGGSIELWVAALSPSVLVMVAKTIEWAQNTQLRHLQIKKYRAELRALEMDERRKATVDAELKAEEEAKLEESARSFAAKTFADQGWKTEDARGDIENGMTMAAKLVHAYLERGGDVHIHLPPSGRGDGPSIRELQDLAARLNALEGQVTELKLLPRPSGDES